MSKPQTPIISAIVAMDENYVIGHDNQLPWYLPGDLQHFKTITKGYPILMGRKTHESIGRALPNRINIVMTREKNYRAEGCFTVTSIEEAIETAKQENKSEIFIIGGAEIYKQLLPNIEKIYLTVIHDEFEGDTHFPKLVPSQWQEIERTYNHADDENAYNYSFITLQRKAPG